MLIIIVVLGLLTSFAGNQLNDCDDLSGFKQLMKGPPRSRNEYRGRYVNLAYDYSVRIPEGMTAYDGRDEARHNGFALGLGNASQSVIFVSGDPNSMDYDNPREETTGTAEFLRQRGRKIESETLTGSHLGTLDAVLHIVIYTCPESTGRHIISSIIALGPDKRFVYELQLYGPADQYESDQAVLTQLQESWKMLPGRGDKTRSMRRR